MGVPAAAAAAAAAIATAAAYSAHARQELRLVHRDLGGIFLVHVEVLDATVGDELSHCILCAPTTRLPSITIRRVRAGARSGAKGEGAGE